MAYHEATGKIVLFGGRSGSSYLGDTWLYDGADWQRVYPNPHPGTCGGTEMVYDPVTQKILFTQGEGCAYEFWEFDGATWTAVDPQWPTGQATYAGMAREPVLDVMVYYGGYISHAYVSERTFIHDGSLFSELLPPFNPGPRYHHRLSYLHALRGVVLFGGSDSTQYFDETWVFRYQSQWPSESCVGGADEDGDGLIDCDDPDCESQPCATGRCVAGTCQAWESLCGNGVDDDGDGQIDCADSDCNQRPCQTGLCAAGVCP